MADMMTPQQHYDAGRTELGLAATLPEPEAATAASRAQGQFLAGILAAILEDQAKQQEPGWEEKEAMREHHRENPVPTAGASPDGP